MVMTLSPFHLPADIGGGVDAEASANRVDLHSAERDCAESLPSRAAAACQ
jgi:hypothetical protein